MSEVKSRKFGCCSNINYPNNAIKKAKKNQVLRNHLGRPVFIGKPKKEILAFVQEKKVSSIELTDRKECAKYADLFKVLNSSQIKELKLSRAMCRDNVEEIRLRSYNKNKSTQDTHLKKVFAQVPDLDSFACSYNEPIMKMMEDFTSLTSLTINDVPYNSDVVKFVSSHASLNVLKLSAEYKDDTITLLTELAKNEVLKNNLTELHLHMSFVASSFEKIIEFKQLRKLCMDVDDVDFSEFNRLPSIVFHGFPETLTHVRIGGLKISCSQFLSIMDKLKLLEVFDVGTGDIFYDTDRDIGLGNIQVSSFIAEKLAEKYPPRTVKIMRIKQIKK